MPHSSLCAFGQLPVRPLHRRISQPAQSVVQGTPLWDRHRPRVSSRWLRIPSGPRSRPCPRPAHGPRCGRSAAPWRRGLPSIPCPRSREGVIAECQADTPSCATRSHVWRSSRRRAGSSRAGWWSTSRCSTASEAWASAGGGRRPRPHSWPPSRPMRGHHSEVCPCDASDSTDAGTATRVALSLSGNQEAFCAELHVHARFGSHPAGAHRSRAGAGDADSETKWPTVLRA